MRRLYSTVMMLLAVAAETDARRKGKGKGRGLGAAAEQLWVTPANFCTVEKSFGCCGDGVCTQPEETEANCMADCPGVTTHATCGEEPHSDRGGKGRTFGVSHRAKSAQECCDKCKSWTRQGGCNSWTFCGYPVCFGLDTGWNRNDRLRPHKGPTPGERVSHP